MRHYYQGTMDWLLSLTVRLGVNVELSQMCTECLPFDSLSTLVYQLLSMPIITTPDRIKNRSI